MAGKPAPRQQLSPRALAYATAQLERRERQRREGLALLSSLDCLQPASESELVRLLDLVSFRAFATGATIRSEAMPGAFLHLLIQGSARLTLRDKNGREVLLGVLGRGDCYGEGPLFGDYFRRAGVFAESSCYVAQLRIAELQPILPSTPQFSEALRRIYRRRLIETTLGRVPLFGQMTAIERLSLAVLMQPRHCARGDMIMRQGEPGEAFYVIEEGQVVVERDGQTIATLDGGDFFGEISLLYNTPHNASIRALTPTDMLVLPAAQFHVLLEQRPEIEAHLHDIVEQRLNNSLSLAGDRDKARRVALAVNHGLRRGSHLLVRTPELCPPDCRICEQACGARYGQPRLHLNGVALGELDVLDTCRQCHAGPECVEACPEDAFEWNDRGALNITDRCTGCGACVTACPYNAVDRVPREHSGGHGPLWQLWAATRRKATQVFHTIPLEPAHHTHRADKCDLCHGHGDLACLKACPTGSLRLVPVEELFSI